MLCPEIAKLPTKTRIIDYYPFLKENKIFPRAYKFLGHYQFTHHEKITRWIIYMYDVNSPFLKEVNDYEARARECAIELSFIDHVWKNKGAGRANEITPIGRALVHKEDPQVALAILRFWRYQNVPKAIQYFSYEDQLFNTLQLVSDPVDEKDASKKLDIQQKKNKILKEDVGAFVNEMDKIRNDVFMGDLWLAAKAVRSRMTEDSEPEFGAIEEVFMEED